MYIIHMSAHKISLKFIRVEIIQSIFSNINVMKLEMNNRKKFQIFLSFCKLTNIFSKQSIGQEKITQEIRKKQV